MSKHPNYCRCRTLSYRTRSHKSIVAYLSSIKLPASAANVREDLKLGDGFDEATSKRYEGVLEKKWNSVVRLQKKVSRKLHWTMALD